jgi:LEA14-like dessication related protein
MRIGYLNGFMLKDDQILRIDKIQSIITTALTLTKHIIAWLYIYHPNPNPSIPIVNAISNFYFNWAYVL